MRVFVQMKYFPLMSLRACRTVGIHVNMFQNNIETDIKEIALMTA
jgi:hypothetical protein